MDSDFIEFNIEDLDAIVAHELGHIIPKNNLTLIMWLLISVFLSTFAFALYSLLYSICISFLFIILLAWFSHLSRNEEYRADTFAVTTASISVEQLVDCLKKLDLVFKREIPVKQRQSIYRKLFRPTLEQRISQLYQINTFKK
jgi:Zn-dependent protease with chaperone function